VRSPDLRKLVDERGELHGVHTGRVPATPSEGEAVLACRPMKHWALGLVLLAGCGGGTNTAIALDAKNAALDELLIEQVCAPELDDAGTCKPSQVRGMERAAFCANTNILFKLGQPVPDSGINCPTP
jgi:hypothetical protein